MERGNVLVVGNSGVGKSTLINAVLGEDAAMTSWGTGGVTNRLEIYESDKIPFRLIDTIGFEPSFIRRHQAIGAVQNWSKDCAKEGKEDTKINMIWFCIDGTSPRLFPETIKNMLKATTMWKSVPIIIAITKSYSEVERPNNIAMVRQSVDEFGKRAKNVKGIIPVVAQTYQLKLDGSSYAPPEGISKLIETTNKHMPEGISAADSDLANFKLNRKRAFAHSAVVLSTAGGAAVGAIPVPVADAAILGPVEVAEINALARIYDIANDDEAKAMMASIVEAGTAGIAAKAAISAIKAIPGINVAGVVINAVVAGSIVFVLGEVTIGIFEKIYLGEKSSKDADWAQEAIEQALSGDFVENVKSVLESITDNASNQDIAKTIESTFAEVK